MSETNVNLGDIPQIGSNQIGTNQIQNKKNIVKPDVAMFDNAPNDVTFGSFFGRIFVGTIVGVCVAALLFGTLTALGGFTDSGDGSVNPLLPVLLPVTGFIVSFIGNVAIARLYNIFFSKRYYSFGKMLGLIFVSSLIIFAFFFIIYALFKDDMLSLYKILGFQIMFGLYISLNLMDFLSQPNYSASSLMGNTLGCVLSIVAFLGILATINNKGTVEPSSIFLPIIISSVISYAVMTLGAGIWDAIYYKFYEWGSNPFYLPSLNELREERKKEELKKEKDEEEVNVDMK